MVWLFSELDQGSVSQRVLADQFRRIRLIVVLTVERHFDLRRVVDHLVVGEDQAVLAADDESCPGSNGRLLPRTRRTASLTTLATLPASRLILVVRLLSAEKAMKEIVGRLSAAAEEIGQVLAALLGLGPDVHHHRLLRLGDVAERLGVERTGDRRAVHGWQA